MGGNAQTTGFLKECLADALIKLMETTPAEQITISEIAKTANVGRTTYFRNFRTKNELISFKLIRLWERWSDQHDIVIRDDFSMDNALNFFLFNYGIRDLLKLIYRRGRQSAVYNAFNTVMYPQRSDDPEKCYKSKFYSYALFGLLDEWILRDFRETPDEMVKISEAF